MKFYTFVFITALTGLMSPGFAADLKSPFELETTKVLPKGVRNPRFKNLVMFVDTKYNGIGQGEPLGNKLNKVVTWADVLEGADTDYDRNMVRGVLADNKDKISDTSDHGSPGSTTGQVNTYANVKVPILAMGVTENLTLAIAVPMMKVEVSADTGFDRAPDGQAFVDALCNSNPDKCNETKDKLNDAINQKLKRLGYEPIQSQIISSVGDVKVVGKYLLSKTDGDALSVKADVTLPTGRAPNVDKALDVPTGDGQWDIGAAVIWDRNILTDFRWNTYGGYTVQLPNSLERRLPKSSIDSLSADKELVHRNLGDLISMGSSLTYELPATGLSVGSGYSFQYLTKTTYDDGAFESYRYRLLENDYPYQALHSATFTLGFSTVDWYKQKKFILPFQANVAYSHPFLGRNVTKNDVIAAELVMFF